MDDVQSLGFGLSGRFLRFGTFVWISVKLGMTG